MVELVGKLSPRAIGWDRVAIGGAVGKVAADGSQPVLLGRFVGVMTGLKENLNKETGEVSYGLKGSFKAISSLADENGALREARSGVCYLPGGIQDIVEAAFTEAQGEDGSKRASISFAMDLYAIPANNAAGYTFKADNLIEAQAADPLDTMLSAVASKKALPAPVASPATDPNPAPAPEPEKAKK